MAYADILDWSNQQSFGWTKDALRRLAVSVGRQLTSEEFDELYACIKKAHGIESEATAEPVPLAEEHLPKESKSTERTVLCSIGPVDVRAPNANGIAELGNGEQVFFHGILFDQR